MSNNDPTQAMLDQYSGAAYDELLNEAKKDDRVGKHNAIIVKKEIGTWPSGETRYKFLFNLITANNSKADLTWSEPPSAQEIAEQKASWDKKRKMGVAHNVSIGRQAIQHYHKRVIDFEEGDTVRVETYKTRRDEDGSGGFIRVAALLPPEGAAAASPSGGPSF